ncbi:MAG: hypothetical protein IJU75_00615 [Clostridia bacterium]|nr:hypothetical protein [Clostridia bacterium]
MNKKDFIIFLALVLCSGTLCVISVIYSQASLILFLCSVVSAFNFLFALKEKPLFHIGPIIREGFLKILFQRKGKLEAYRFFELILSILFLVLGIIGLVWNCIRG